MPETAGKIWKQLGLRSLQEEALKSILDKTNASKIFDWEWKPDYEIKAAKGEHLFPRIETRK